MDSVMRATSHSVMNRPRLKVALTGDSWTTPSAACVHRGLICWVS